MIRIAVCDDCVTALEYICQQLEANFKLYPLPFTISSFSCGRALLNANVNEPFDILFLDIRMPAMDGFDIASEVRRYSPNAYIIFVTSNHELVYKSFDYQPFYFVCKDRRKKLGEDIAHVVASLAEQVKRYSVKTLELPYNKIESIVICNIIYIENDGHYLIYYVQTGSARVPGSSPTVKYRVRGSMSEVCEEMREYGFFRIHRRFLVNSEHVKRIEQPPDSVLMSDNSLLDVGRIYRDALTERFSCLLRDSDC